MSDRARETVERLVEAMNNHDPQAVVELLAEGVLFWEPTYSEPRRGRDAVRRELEGFFAMLPDIRYTTEIILAEGDRALHEWTYRASYEGRPVELRECSAIHFDGGGQMAEVRVYFDRLTLLRQLGLAPDL